MSLRLTPRAATAGVVLVAVGAALTFQAGSGGSATRRAAARPAPAPTTATTPPVTAAPPAPLTRGAGWVATENARAGTLGWTVQHPSTAGQIEAYADRVSAQVGDTVELFVTSTAPTWNATAYRMGWYGGALARQVWRSPLQRGVRQPAATYTRATGMIVAHWAPSLAVPITSDWPPGDYLFKLVASTGWDTYVPLTVRDDASNAPILIVNAVTTWQAYNLWGGADLYSSYVSGAGGRAYAGSRADVVSFDRPYRLGNGSGDFLGNEEKLVKLVEMAGLDVSYTTDVDLAEHPQLLLQHRVIVSLGHDEYYSTAMRDALEAARDRGVNLVFLGANAVYRHIRLQPSALGPDRVEVNYRIAGLDPDNRTDPAEVTVSWRQAPVNRPESTLLGEMYQCNPVRADMVITDPAAWMWADAGLAAGRRLPGLIGSEYDHWDRTQRQPAGSGVELLAQSPLSCRGRSGTSDFTYYVAPSGAGVLDTGTNAWVPSILDDPRIGRIVARVTLTILQAASAGPLGQNHPARPTSARAAIPVPRGPAPQGGD
jgi:hypothetical protein